mgnify:CR=1 FL=1
MIVPNNTIVYRKNEYGYSLGIILQVSQRYSLTDNLAYNVYWFHNDLGYSSHIYNINMCFVLW